MDSEKFIAGLVQSVHETSVSGILETLKAPSGRRPHVRQVELSQWFNGMPATDQERLGQVIEQAVHAALFGTLCVLDGVRAIEDGPGKSELQLLALDEGGSERLNAPEAECLHDIYQGHVYERVFGSKA